VDSQSNEDEEATDKETSRDGILSYLPSFMNTRRKHIENPYSEPNQECAYESKKSCSCQPQQDSNIVGFARAYLIHNAAPLIT